MKYILVLGSLSVLAACSSIQNTLGLTKSKPDAFAVVSRVPLEMPPDYNTLPTPIAGAARPQEAPTSATARATVLGVGGASSGGETSTTSGESALLATAGAGGADPNIRATVDAEAGVIAEKNRSSIEKLTGLKVGGDGQDPEALDPVEEAKRMRGKR